MTANQIVLARRPAGEPTAADFALEPAELPDLAEGQVLVRNTWMSVDPYMRGRMDAAPPHVMPPFELRAPLEGAAVGEVVESRAGSLPAGTTVVHFLGWRDTAILDAESVTPVDVSVAPPEAYLGALGFPGLTAYVAVTEIAPVREGDVVFVSAAAGAVGSVAGQVARALGAARVIGSAGGPAKRELLLGAFGFDAALDHRAGPIGGQLAAAAPDGIDVYVDNVGGDHLEAAIEALRPHGRVAMVGAVAQYNATEPPAVRNLYTAAIKEVTLRGMLGGTYLARFPEWTERAAGWLADGTLRTETTVVDGLERAPAALIGVLRGENTGKMLVRLAA